MAMSRKSRFFKDERQEEMEGRSINVCENFWEARVEDFDEVGRGEGIEGRRERSEIEGMERAVPGERKKERERLRRFRDFNKKYEEVRLEMERVQFIFEIKEQINEQLKIF